MVTFILWLSSLHSISLDVFLRREKPAAHHGKFNLAIRPCLNAKEIESYKFQVTFINRCQDLPFLGHVDKWIHKLFPTGHHLFHGQGDPTCLLETLFSSSASNWKRKYLVNITPHEDMSGMFSYLITVGNVTILIYFWKCFHQIALGLFQPFALH